MNPSLKKQNQCCLIIYRHWRQQQWRCSYDREHSCVTAREGTAIADFTRGENICVFRLARKTRKQIHLLSGASRRGENFSDQKKSSLSNISFGWFILVRSISAVPSFDNQGTRRPSHAPRLFFFFASLDVFVVSSVAALRRSPFCTPHSVCRDAVQYHGECAHGRHQPVVRPRRQQR